VRGLPDRRFLPYCSGYCCTASIKEAMLALEHEPEAEVTIFFNDIRTSGKGFEELYLRAQRRSPIHQGLRGASIRATMAARSSALRTRKGGAGGTGRGSGGPGRGFGGAREPLPFGDLAPARDGWAFIRSATPSCTPWSPPCRESSGRHLPGPRDIAETVCQGSGWRPGLYGC